MKPGGGANETFLLTAPPGVRTVAFKVTATSGSLSDGELRPLPVLPSRMHLVQSRFVTLRDGQKKELHFEDLAKGGDPTLVNEQMVVTVDAQLFYAVLEALPYLVNYPYECTEQTLNRFVSTGIVSSIFEKYPSVAAMAKELSKRDVRLETWDAADPNRKMTLEESPWLVDARGGQDAGHGLAKVLDPRVAKAEREAAIAKLRKAQTSIGGFPWWPGGPAVALHDRLHPPRPREGDGVRRRGPEGHGPAGLELRREALPRRPPRHDEEGLLLGDADLRQLRRELLPRPVLDGRRAHGGGAEGDPRLLLQALEAALALPQGIPRPDAEADGPREGRAARLRERHGLGEDDRGAGDLLGARGPLLALVQRHDRDAGVRPPDADRALAEGPAARRARPVALPEQEAEPVEVDPRDGRGPLLARPLPEDRGGARDARDDEGDGRRARDGVRVRARQVHREEEPGRHPGAAGRPEDDLDDHRREGGQGLRLRLGRVALLDREAPRGGPGRLLPRLAALLPAREHGKGVGPEAARRRHGR